MKVGPGAPPILTDRGWLEIYHGVFQTMGGAVYRLGVALLDRDDPSRVIGVADDWILQPEDPWEVTGYVPNVVFSCGAVPEPDGQDLDGGCGPSFGFREVLDGRGQAPGDVRRRRILERLPVLSEPAIEDPGQSLGQRGPGLKEPKELKETLLQFP